MMRTSVLLLLVACSGSSSSKKPDAGGGGSDAPPGFDYGSGTWLVEQVSHTAQTISHTPALTFLDDGTPIAAWAEPPPGGTFDEDIFTSIKTGGSWSAEDRRTNDTNIQNAYGRLVAHGQNAHLVWSGYPSMDNDIFYSHYQGTSWTARSDLTTTFETSAVRDDRIPSLAVGPQGQLAVAYSSSTADSSGNPNGPFEIRVLELDKDGTPTGMPTTVIPAPSGGCGQASVAIDANGKVHVVADCGASGGEDLYYATNAGGSWTSTVVPGGANRDDYNGLLALDPDGQTLHLVWNAFTACTGGTGTCSDILYEKIQSGGTFGSEVHVTSTGNDSEMVPAIAVDAAGRPIVSYELANSNNFFDVYVTWSSDGQTFQPARDITPNTDARDDYGATQMMIHPTTGLPHVIFYSTFETTPEVNTEIMHAEYMPPLN